MAFGGGCRFGVGRLPDGLNSSRRQGGTVEGKRVRELVGIGKIPMGRVVPMLCKENVGAWRLDSRCDSLYALGVALEDGTGWRTKEGRKTVDTGEGDDNRCVERARGIGR